MNKHTLTVSVLLAVLVAIMAPMNAQTRKGDISASASYSALFYRGDFVSDRAGDGGLFTLSYNTSDRFWIEGRIGFGAYHWQTNPTLIKKFADYYGPSAALGGVYPGSTVKIESQNQASLTALDVTFGYVLVQNTSFVPFVTGGFGLVSFRPSNTSGGESLPNYQNGVYPSSVACIPLGVGVLVPIADQLSLSARYDHRFVFSGYLDDYEVRGANDGLSALSIGLSYRFSDRAEQGGKGQYWCEQCSTWYDVNNCAICATQNCEICKQRKAHQDDLAVSQQPAVPTQQQVQSQQPIQPEPPAPEVAPEPEPAPAPAPAPASAKEQPMREAGSSKKLNAQGIRFNVNSDVIDFTDPTTKTRMDEMLDYLTQDCDDLEVLVEGHASVDGPAKRNQELSALRARAVAKWLLENGVPSERIKGAIGYGSSMPKVSDPLPSVARKMTKQQLEAIREQNRRIELSVLKDCE
jgi:outer membrane protein OmpA-like peptidoglycan-associated protein